MELDLSSNTLSGTIPLEISNMRALTLLNLSRNQISGNIPESMGGLKTLLNLSLAHNKFQGPIPKSLGGMISIEFLDLSQNYLSGVIPKSLESLVYMKLNIMIDVASALEYLHSGSSTPVVHCDVKPSNVLLDENMVAHLSDFGIAKLLGDTESEIYTKTLATIGYMAPEYGSKGAISSKGDVYSYGILLMEMLTRKNPTDDLFNESLSLKDWVSKSTPHSIINILDVICCKETIKILAKYCHMCHQY
ncbi:LRR receptor-like serine/threonine-protein kinase FLS2 [Prosopis cineraria]|uniref:LRR receptor-like serine/threonine-protein kinase FLS2 n=1 Tax=Prosopis cineraria TaxID=364024 RepID=UPI00240EDA8F|nr:LRR receptor-like serine/threonine-protein kinase FLS2 [Prosopis cineraria]